MGWGWVGLDGDFSVFGGLDWVGSTIIILYLLRHIQAAHKHTNHTVDDTMAIVLKFGQQSQRLVD